MSRIGGVVAAIVLAGGLVNGCTSRSEGEPHPQDGVSTQESSSASSKPRPRELRLDGKDPCALIPSADRAKFYIERPGVPSQSEVFKSPECHYGTDVGGFNVALVTTEGIGKWTDGSRIAEAREVAPIAGFPALSITVAASRYGCDVAVDVAEGQYLLAGVIVISGAASRVPERCEYAHQLAESVMSTLVAS